MLKRLVSALVVMGVCLGSEFGASLCETFDIASVDRSGAPNLTAEQRSLILAVTDPILDRATDLWVLGPTTGHPHRDADLIIAATALDLRYVLVTGNTQHFSWIPGLTIEDWRQP